MLLKPLVLGILSVLVFADDAFPDVTISITDGAGQVGGFYGEYLPGDDAPGSYPATIAPDNDASFQNYFMGRTTVTGFTTPERRAFFIFDTSGVSIPGGEAVTGVSIELELLSGGVLANFTGDSESVSFSGTPFGPTEILDPPATMTDPVDIWATFGSGPAYGDFVIAGPDSMTEPQTVPGIYEIPLPGAVSDLDASLGGLFIVTAKLDTFDPGPIGSGAPPAVDPTEFVFGLTDVHGGVAIPSLIIETTAVPEPTSYAIFILLGVFAFLRYKRKPLAAPQ